MKQRPVFHGKYPGFFFSWLTCEIALLQRALHLIKFLTDGLKALLNSHPYTRDYEMGPIFAGSINAKIWHM